MKKVTWAILAAMILLFGHALSADAWGISAWHHGSRSRVFVGTRVFIGPPVWWGPPWWWGPPYPYYAAPPVVVPEAPRVYIQQDPAPQQPSYWYYCPNPVGYYPYVTECPSGWLTVVPPAGPPAR